MSKKILNAQETRIIAKETIEEVADIVTQTLGPKGNPIIIESQGLEFDGITPKRPHITKDGITVAKSITYTNHAKETIKRAIIEASANTVNAAGDGTTSTMVILKAVFMGGLRHIQQGNNGIKLLQDLKKLAEVVVEMVDDVKIDVDLDQVKDVALISCNGDEEIADVVHKAVTKVGEDGYIKIEDGFSRETVLDIKDGSMYIKGYTSFGPQGAHLVTDKARGVCDLDSPAVVLCNQPLTDAAHLDHIMSLFKTRVPIIIIAHELSDDVREYVLKQRIHHGLPIACIKTPFDGSPNGRTEIMADLAAMTGATPLARGILDIDKFTLEHVGQADRVEVYAKETVFYRSEEFYDCEELNQRVADLKILLDDTDASFDADNLRIRIAKLVGGVGVIRVGGNSEAEIAERKDRTEDALCSARAAIKDGIVEGGGYTLYKIAKELKAKEIGTGFAFDIFCSALEAPIRKIIENAGENAEVVLSHLPEGKGFDAKNMKHVNLLEEGIIDAALVVKSAVTNAVSVAGILLTTGGGIVVEDSPGFADGQTNPLAALQGLMG